MEVSSKSVWLDKYLHKTILVWGLGREGLSSYRFLRRYLPKQRFVLADRQSLAQLPSEFAQIMAEDDLAEYKSDQMIKLTDFDWVVKSAGISPYRADVEAAKLKGTLFTSNTQIFFEVMASMLKPGKFPRYPLVIGVTGTKGKTTTTTMIYHLLKSAHLNVHLAGGNAGIPSLNLITPDVLESHDPIFVLELSSHQLNGLTHSPQIGVVQALTPEHQDYFPSLESYYQSKIAIAKFQTDQDKLIYFADSPETVELAKLGSASKISMSLQDSARDLALDDGWLTFLNQKIIQVNDLPLKGKHNIANVLPALAVGQYLGFSIAQIKAGLMSFTSVEHRLELVRTVRGVQFINDSAGTTPEAAVAAIHTFAAQPLILLVGGSEKGVSFTDLAQTILKAKVKLLLLFPKTGQEILREVQQLAEEQNLPIPPYYQVDSMPAAFAHLKDKIQTGDVVLLSPACASFTTFKNYQDRGQQFKKQTELID